MIKYKGVFQHDEKDCGIACIATICRFYGIKISIAQLRNMTKANMDGYSIDELVTIAAQLGFDAEGQYGEEGELFDAIERQQLILPFIAHIKKSEGEFHFIVVFGKNQNQLEVFDPARGKIKLRWKDFLDSWTGYIVSIVKTEQFCPQNLKKGYYEYYTSLIWKNKLCFCQLIIISILVSGISIGVAYAYKKVIDDLIISAINNSGMGKAYFVFSVLLVIYFIQTLLLLLRGRIIAYLGSKLEMHMLDTYFESILYSKFAFFDSYKKGEIISRYYDIDKVKKLLVETPVQFVLDLFMSIAVIVTVGKLNLTMLIVVMIVLMTYLAVLYVFHSTLFQTNRSMVEKETEVVSLLKEIVEGVKLIKSHCVEMKFKKKLENVANDFIIYKHKNQLLISDKRCPFLASAV